MTRLINTNFRRGFTLVELLIVVAIIGLLMSIVGVAVVSSLTGAKIAATKATMTKIQRQLQSRIESVNRIFAGRSSNTSFFSQIAGVQKLAGTLQGSNPGRYQPAVDALTRKVYLQAYLPQTWAEANFLLKKAGKSAPTSINPQASIGNETESAEVLYFLLSDSTILGFTPANQDLFSGSEVRDTDNNGALEIVDGWGHAVRFYRWPTRLLRPDGFTGTTIAGNAVTKANYDRAQVLIEGIPSSLKLTPSLTPPTNLANDPDDPFNVLTPGNGLITSAGDISNFESGTAPPLPFHTVFSWHSPLVVSAGPDAEFGIYQSNVSGHFGRLCEPYTSGTEETYLYDNITNLNVKSGGK